ncbi:type 2 DNA topoisomerase 6 subunit B-like [Senna tora]|uniref:Type 2 DNA topoisomerase 6 subunit B-like n=1 Tax=Senna tora TaxID=362788 RepID=A0A834W896_9FABA|nr:type 2 DNA topoisomerase 6 subunit B-like [Senna tora]
MEFSSVSTLCLHLISSAYQRCRLSDQICRLSVIINRSSSSHHTSVQISISDTGIGSCLEEFQALKFSWGGLAENWDGVLRVKTTTSKDIAGMGDTEIHNYQLNLKESGSSRRIDMLPSNTKNGAKFRHAKGQSNFLCYFMNSSTAQCWQIISMLILRIPNIAIQLVAEDCDVPESRYEKIFLANECMQLPLSATNLECLKSGFKEYILKHGNGLNTKCNSCFPSWENLKVGAGIACCTGTELVMEAIIVISDLPKEKSTCFRESGDKTEVLYFNEFSPCAISQSSMKALKSVDWRRYGLNLVGIAQQDGYALLEWENLPTETHIDITMIPAPRRKSQIDRNLVKRTVKLALDDLKDKHAGVLLSAQAIKIRSYAPDLAKTIAGLIMSSNDIDFQIECLSLLGLQSEEAGPEIVENHIKERIVSVIDMNDKKAQKTKENAPFLFEDDRLQEVEFQEKDYEGDYHFSPLDL